jgi:hypothetical protein
VCGITYSSNLKKKKILNKKIIIKINGTIKLGKNKPKKSIPKKLTKLYCSKGEKNIKVILEK